MRWSLKFKDLERELLPDFHQSCINLLGRHINESSKMTHICTLKTRQINMAN